MSSLSIYLFFSAALLLLHPSVANVNDTCKEAAQNDPNINFNFCVKSLNSDPTSANADTKGLAVIAVTLAQSKATANNAKIDTLLSKVKDPKTKKALDTCASVYSDMISDLHKSKSEIKGGKYIDASFALSAALDAPGDCEDGFSEMGVPSPLSRENADAQSLCAIALFLDVKLRG